MILFCTRILCYKTGECGVIKTILIVLCTISFLFSNTCTANQKLANYLGTGSKPRLHLELSPDNGPRWTSFNIDYQQTGNIPWSKKASLDYSPWNILDEKGNYYGRVTLHSDGHTASIENM